MGFSLVALALLTLTAGSWFFYTLTIQVDNNVQILQYNFTVVNVTPTSLVFELTTYNSPNGMSLTFEKAVPLSEPAPFPYNGSAFGVSNVSYVGSVGNYTIYRGVFELNGLKVPVTLYFRDGILVNYTGSYEGVKVDAQLQASQIVPTNASGPEPGALIIVLVMVAAIAIGAAVLIKIGKI
ncbi:MAG: hypothetical protein RXQ70_04350 [Sulfolobaceae archaeon]|nr:hypothetical protein [Sulfolobales archaeon]